MATSPTRTSEAAPVDSSFTPTADLSRLIALVKQAPEVRADFIADASARLVSGELLSAQAAQDTAASILDAKAAN